MNTTLSSPKSEPFTLEAKIKAEAFDLGFVAVGFSSIVLTGGLQKYSEWLEQGHHGSMGFLASSQALEARADPRLLLPSCRTVISLLSNYAPPSDLQVPEGKGRIAAYALQRDYHDLLSERLHQLAARITHLAEDVQSYAGVDSSPILEKGYAHKAGLGWIGKNSLLLHPQFGSWTFLSELLVSLELEPDPASEFDGCGTCQCCIRACPTQAILPNRTIDARRCLSYLTIENRGSIPAEFRSAVGNRVFGCDQCQVVCPVNKKAPKTTPQTLIEECPDLMENFTLSAEEFRQRYRKTPVWRAKYGGFRRNLAIALGNSGQKELISPLQNALEKEENQIVAEAIRWALEELGSPSQNDVFS